MFCAAGKPGERWLNGALLRRGQLVKRFLERFLNMHDASLVAAVVVHLSDDRPLVPAKRLNFISRIKQAFDLLVRVVQRAHARLVIFLFLGVLGLLRRILLD